MSGGWGIWTQIPQRRAGQVGNVNGDFIALFGCIVYMTVLCLVYIPLGASTFKNNISTDFILKLRSWIPLALINYALMSYSVRIQ
jgi:hypothetical protein